MSETPDATRGVYPVDENGNTGLSIDQQKDKPGRPSRAVTSVQGAARDRIFFLAQKQPDGTYVVTLTEEGVRTFETALGIADDLGGKTRISPNSTIADIMERTATREELARLLRQGDDDRLHRIRMLVLQRKLRGSEKPSARQTTIGHIGKTIIVAIVGLWALTQFAIAIRDIAEIPAILANMPNDILHLHPTSAFDEVDNRISDAGRRILFGVLGACLTYVAASVIRPFGKIYRNDQIIPAERITLDLVNRALRRADHPPAQLL